jgi:hypothetical protein
MSDAPTDPHPSSSVPGPRPGEGAAGGAADPLHRERLLPSLGVWVVGVAFGSILGVILVPLSHLLALVIGIVGIAAVCVMLALASPVLEVSGGVLHAGRAQIPARLLGEPEELDREAWGHAMSRGFEPLAFHLTRGWIATGVRVPVLDEQDPAPAWVLSSRRPEDLALAIRTARAARP